MSGIKVVPSVFTIIRKDNKVLLLRRLATGYMDGWYDLPAGHLEDREGLKQGAARELAEETSLHVEPDDLKLVHVYQNHTSEIPHYGYIFLAKKWTGQPEIIEKDKCDDMGFFSLDNLPERTLPYTKFAIENIDSQEVNISYHEPNSIKQN
jgi:8-oxo-dGTP diphosphatase